MLEYIYDSTRPRALYKKQTYSTEQSPLKDVLIYTKKHKHAHLKKKKKKTVVHPKT